jgi:c-di-GMP-binding flagellar brake protein YcgR
MEYNELNMGLKLELQLIDINGNKINKPFISEFEYAASDKSFFIAAPISEGNYYPVQIGTKVAISFARDGCFYGFEAVVTARENKNNLAMLKIQPIGQIVKIQRREFFRFESCIPVNYREFGHKNIRNAEDLKFISTVTRDISGGGLCVRLTNPIELNKLLEFELFITSKVEFLGRVVRFTKYDTMQGIYKYEMGVVYEMIDTTTREKIISYIFQEQRRLLKKG